MKYVERVERIAAELLKTSGHVDIGFEIAEIYLGWAYERAEQIADYCDARASAKWRAKQQAREEASVETAPASVGYDFACSGRSSASQPNIANVRPHEKGLTVEEIQDLRPGDATPVCTCVVTDRGRAGKHTEQTGCPVHDVEPPSEAFLSGYNAGKHGTGAYDVGAAWATYLAHGGRRSEAAKSEDSRLRADAEAEVESLQAKCRAYRETIAKLEASAPRSAEAPHGQYQPLIRALALSTEMSERYGAAMLRLIAGHGADSECIRISRDEWYRFRRAIDSSFVGAHELRRESPKTNDDTTTKGEPHGTVEHLDSRHGRAPQQGEPDGREPHGGGLRSPAQESGTHGDGGDDHIRRGGERAERGPRGGSEALGVTEDAAGSVRPAAPNACATGEPADGDRVHYLKCWPPFFDAVESGAKRFEFRENDRDYQVGDVLALADWDPQTAKYSGRHANVRVTHLLAGGAFGLPAKFCVMSIEPLPKAPTPSSGPGRWRVGRTLGRTIYSQDGCIGMVDSPALALRIVDLLNQSESTLPSEVPKERPREEDIYRESGEQAGRKGP